MLELLTATGLASAAGLNAYVPLLALGALARWTDLLEVPEGWEWLSHEWVLGVLAVLLVVDLVADKVPVLDSVHDAVQTAVRPTAGGIAFGAGVGTETVAVDDPTFLAQFGTWVPVVVGVALALGVHLAKSLARPVLNAATGGLAAPVVSATEDAFSVALTFAAILVPVLAGVLLLVAVVVAVRWRRRRALATAGGNGTPPAVG